MVVIHGDPYRLKAILFAGEQIGDDAGTVIMGDLEGDAMYDPVRVSFDGVVGTIGNDVMVAMGWWAELGALRLIARGDAECGKVLRAVNTDYATRELRGSAMVGTGLPEASLEAMDVCNLASGVGHLRVFPYDGSVSEYPQVFGDFVEGHHVRG